MTGTIAAKLAAGLLLAAALAGCSGAARAPESTAVRPATGPHPAAHTSRDTTLPPPNDADLRFMTGMVRHHNQAVLIAGWAPSHGASDAMRRLCERIVVGQEDEIALMARWLRRHGETVPAADSSHDMMAEMDHGSMPGMLTAEELAQLDRARGAEFDRLFLTSMLKHHRGALVMVDELFGSQGAAQDETVFRIASDVYADQSTEIGRMEKMLAALPAQGSTP